MPQLAPLALAFPQQTDLASSSFKNVRGPTVFLECLKHSNWSEVKQAVDHLFEKKEFHPQEAQHYWYRITQNNLVFEGILTGVALENNSTPISTHENVLNERVQLFSDYLTEVNRQAEPLLLVHESPDFSTQLKEQICTKTPDFSFTIAQEKHELWGVPPAQAKALERFALGAPQLHLADGHHRLASTLDWGKKQKEEAVVLAFILAHDQLTTDSFLWAFKEDTLLENTRAKQLDYNPDLPLWVQTKKGIHSFAVPENENTVLYLYHELLGGPKAIKNTKIDYFPQGKMPLHLRTNYAAIFGYTSLKIEEIIALAKQQIKLPPKSTYILPKLPTGLFIAPLTEG